MSFFLQISEIWAREDDASPVPLASFLRKIDEDEDLLVLLLAAVQLY